VLSRRAIPKPDEPAALRRWLKEQIETIESCHRKNVPAVPTGWGLVDAALNGGLQRGALHEWFGLCQEPAQRSDSRSAWTPPLLLLSHLAHRGAGSCGWTAWIGRRVWPTAHALICEGTSVRIARTLLVDPSTAADCVWAIDAALRCTGLIVIADGSALTTAGTRRLQLAAEAGGSLGLVSRPEHQLGSLSVAATRWTVSSIPAATDRPRWKVSLVRCKGAGAAAREVTIDVEWAGQGTAVAVPVDVGERSRAPRAAS